MTLSTLDIAEMKRHLHTSGKDLKTLGSLSGQMKQKAVPLTGKALARRLKGLLTPKEADLFEKHINESCEQEND